MNDMITKTGIDQLNYAHTLLKIFLKTEHKKPTYDL